MKTILLLEDDESLNRGITFTLEKEGYMVCSAFSIEEAENSHSEGTGYKSSDYTGR